MRYFFAIFAVGIAARAVAAPPPPLSSRRPISEYEPIGAVLLPEDLFHFDYRANELVRAIVKADASVWIMTPGKSDEVAVKRLLTKNGVDAFTLQRVAVVAFPHDNIWIRDYGPIPVLETTSMGPAFRLADFRYDDGSPVSDALPTAVATRLGTEVESVPIYVDGGNFLVAGDLCLTSGPTESATGEMTPGPTALKAHAAQLGCREVIVLKDPPHVHIDMWVKAVGDKTLLVNELTAETIAVADKTGLELRPLRDRLDQMAAELSATFKVLRIPMPLPYRGVFRTYSNAILVNGHAIVPSFKRFGWNYDEYPDHELRTSYEERVRKIYKDAGFEPTFINADGMIFNGGAFHCVTVALPKPFSLPPPLKGT